MKKQLSDEKLDLLIGQMMKESMVEDDELDNIAASPSIWWGVQRNIAQNAAPWPPPIKWLRVFFIGAPATAALLLLGLYFFASLTIVPADDRASVSPAYTPSLSETKTSESPAPTLSETQKSEPSNLTVAVKPLRASTARVTRPALQQVAIQKKDLNRKHPTTAETIKTDFIALSYAKSPESGQIVRVKVPSSMMVTLGLVNSVAEPASLVDAEVLVGDDGLTHSIRFVRKGL